MNYAITKGVPPNCRSAGVFGDEWELGIPERGDDTFGRGATSLLGQPSAATVR